MMMMMMDSTVLMDFRCLKNSTHLGRVEWRTEESVCEYESSIIEIIGSIRNDFFLISL